MNPKASCDKKPATASIFLFPKIVVVWQTEQEDVMANVEHLKIRGDESLKKGIQKAIACLWRIKAGKDFYWAFYLGKNKVIVYGRDTLRIAKKRAKKQISSSSL